MKFPSHFRLIDLTVEQFQQLMNDLLNQLKSDIQFPKYTTRKIGIDELCSLYGWSKSTVYGWISKRYIPVSKIGRLLVFDLDAIEKWIDEHRIRTKREIENF